MNPLCNRCEDWLQELLDGNETAGEVLSHLATCPACRDLYEAATDLRRGLALMPVPEAPAHLEDQIVAALLVDHDRRQRRRRVIVRVAALAAAVLLGLFIAELQKRPETQPIVQAPPESQPSLRETVAQAGSAVADLTTRKAEEALESTRLFWPRIDSTGFEAMGGVTSPLEPTTRPLQTASQGVSAGLEPVTDRARRAFALFVRDLPASSLMSKPGS